MSRMVEKGVFRFKKFSVRHTRSSMKVGVDGVLLGAWGGVEGNIGLDIGTGCGLIALMAAQRNPEAEITAIDNHQPSVEEAAENFNEADAAGRLKAFYGNVLEFGEKEENAGRFDFILSNPPYFDSGIDRPVTAREQARHQGELTLEKLATVAARMLKKGGRFSLIIPFEFRERITLAAADCGLYPTRICTVADKPGKKPKRIMVEFEKKSGATCAEELLYLREENGSYSQAYKSLTDDFYLGLP